MDGRLQVFTGSAHPQLAKDIMSTLDAPLGRAIVDQWRNGETRVRLEESVRGSDVFVIQPLCDPVNHNIIELLLLIDALRRASAARITAVVPYFGYARQEKKTTGREPISAKVVSNIIVTAGVDRLLAIDLHAPAIEGFFDIPVDHLRGTPLLARRFHQEFGSPVVAVSPDAGGVNRAEDFRARVGGSLAIISKQRPFADEAEVIEMVGDVDGKPCIIVDDMISTGSTLVEAAELLARRGASEIFAAATHGVFAADAIERIDASPISRVIVTDSVPIPELKRDMVEVVTIAPMLAEAIMRIHSDMSVSALFPDDKPQRSLGQPRIWLESTTSTMDEIRLREPGSREGLTVVTNQQTAGRGRLGRSWHDSPGRSLLFSTLLHPACRPEQFQLFPLAAGLAVAAAIEKLNGVTPHLKWPNDLLVEDRKLSGLLVTSRVAASVVESSTIGIGINLTAVPRAVGVNAISLEEAAGRTIDREDLLDEILRLLGISYQSVLDGDTEWIVEQWTDRAAWMGQEVAVETPQGTCIGRLIGIDQFGRLLLLNPGGSTQAIAAGDVTRGVRRTGSGRPM